jgi:hypothetical protein
MITENILVTSLSKLEHFVEDRTDSDAHHAKAWAQGPGYILTREKRKRKEFKKR